MGQEAVYQLANEPMTDIALGLYQKAFQTNNLLVRQAISESLTEIPDQLKTDYESLLKTNLTKPVKMHCSIFG